MHGRYAAPMENSTHGTQTMPAAFSTGAGRLFSTVGAKPGESEAAEAFQLSTPPRLQRVHSAAKPMLKTTAEIHTRAETNGSFKEAVFLIPLLEGRRLSHLVPSTHSTIDRCD